MLIYCKIFVYLNKFNFKNHHIMKKIYSFLIAFATVFTLSAQNIKPKFVKVDDKVKATYFHQNGSIEQIGYFVNGKLDGEWVSYDADGLKVSVGNYVNGIKTGKWFFWNGDQLSEVSYSNNKILGITSWGSDSDLVANFRKP